MNNRMKHEHTKWNANPGRYEMRYSTGEEPGDFESHNEECIGVVLPGHYDGVLFWECSDGKLRNRWSKDVHLFKVAEKQMAKWLEHHEVGDRREGDHA